MDSRIKLKVLGISYSQIQSGAYALILAQVNGPVRIPVVIGAAEAQSIALRMEGIFSSELTFTDGERTVVLDSRTSDAIAIAMRTNAPIYTTREILEETGFVMESKDDDEDTPETRQDATNREPRPENLAIEELERELSRLIEAENYEEAARISEILQRKKKERDEQQ